MSDLLTIREAATILGLAATPRAVRALPIRRVVLSPRRTRWRREDVEAYIACRSTSTRPRNAGASPSIVSLRACDTELRSSFRRAGVEIQPRSAYLTNSELADLTGKKTAPAQARRLQALKIPFRWAVGTPVKVLRSDVDGRPPAAPEPAQEPDFTVFRQTVKRVSE